MKAMARSAFEEVAADPEVRAKIDFRVGELPDAEGDATLIRQVWTNLLSNAVKFSARVDQPVIEVDGSVEGGVVVYHVRDNGAGFDMAFADKLFGVFQRLHGATEYEGTGIGLVLVQRIVARHGGRVRGKGRSDRGRRSPSRCPRRGGPASRRPDEGDGRGTPGSRPDESVGRRLAGTRDARPRSRMIPRAGQLRARRADENLRVGNYVDGVRTFLGVLTQPFRCGRGRGRRGAGPPAEPAPSSRRRGGCSLARPPPPRGRSRPRRRRGAEGCGRPRREGAAPRTRPWGRGRRGSRGRSRRSSPREGGAPREPRREDEDLRDPVGVADGGALAQPAELAEPAVAEAGPGRLEEVREDESEAASGSERADQPPDERRGVGNEAGDVVEAEDEVESAERAWDRGMQVVLERARGGRRRRTRAPSGRRRRASAGRRRPGRRSSAAGRAGGAATSARSPRRHRGSGGPRRTSTSVRKRRRSSSQRTRSEKAQYGPVGDRVVEAGAAREEGRHLGAPPPRVEAWPREGGGAGRALLPVSSSPSWKIASVGIRRSPERR